MSAPGVPAPIGDEVWLPAPDFPRYEVSDHGNVRRSVGPTNQVPAKHFSLTPRKGSGYVSVLLRNGSTKKFVYVHKLVCLAFIGARPSDSHQVAHADGRKSNNALSNLRWATPLENAADKNRHGTTLRGDSHPARTGRQRIKRGDEHWSASQSAKITRGAEIGTSKLTEAQVQDILAEPKYHGVNTSLAKKFGVSDVLIGRIRSGRQWSWIHA